MKLPKTLLNSIMVAVTIGTISSCTKTVGSKTNKQPDTKSPKNDNTPASCPACGMG